MNVRSVLFVIPFILIFQSRTVWGQEVVDASTLDQKIMAGYQGWFNASGDGSGYGWIHWSRSGAMPAADNITFDMWPDMREYEKDELFETKFIYPDLSNAGLYSAYTSKTVDRHVKWMKDYGIDGVFVQRFISSALSRGDLRDSVLQNVRRAAEKHGRVFANMYDLSGGKETMVEDVKNDWMHLVDDLQILESPNYLHHNGRPVLSIWGFNVGGSRGGLTAGMAAEMVRWFTEGAPEKYRVTLKGGVNDDWCTQSSEWQSVYDELDIISPWAVGRYGSESGADNFRTNNIEPDLINAEGRGADYMPVVFPGFSWFNLKGEKFNHIKRNGGSFFWRQMYNAVDAGCDMMYVAMYDEVDEGTAIFKLAENAGQTPTTGRFVTLDIDGFHVPSDWYLRLTGAGTRMLRGEIPVSSSIPIEPYPDDAAFESQEAPTVMAPASATFVELSFTNKGTTVWSGKDQYRLRFTGSPDSLFWGNDSPFLESGESVAPGQKKTFVFEISAPGEEGVYPFQWQMARDSLGNFGESSSFRYIEVGNTIRYLDDCDALSEWEPALNLSLNNTNQKQGGGCIEYSGTSEGRPEFQKVFPEAYSSGIPVHDGILQFWYFVSDATLLGPEPIVQLGSGGEKNLDVFSWSLSDLCDGWNLLALELGEALISGSPDAEALNWFCLAAGQDASLITRIDDIRMFDRFDGVQRYNLVVNNGSGSGQYVEDAILTIQAGEAPAAQEFISWVIDSGDPLIGDFHAQSTSLRMPAKDVEISARYKLLGIYVDDCDLLRDWGSSAALSLNTTNQQEVLGCIEFTGSSTDEFKKTFSTPYNPGVSAESGKLQFWYYVSDPGLLESSNQV